MTKLSDRQVNILGDQLKGRRVDFVVSGGIAAIESPKIIRELRRYGAEVRVLFTQNAASFVQPLVFEWASERAVVTQLSGQAEHISGADAVVVSPASLNFLGKLALGLADCPASTAVQSVLGRKPVFVQPTMHESLLESPAYRSHREALGKIAQLEILEPKREESKAKSSEPEEIVARVCHGMNRRDRSVLVFAGPTRSYLDDIRFLSNRSSGRLGVEISKDLYRWGFELNLILGPTELPVPPYLAVTRVETRQEMLERAKDLKKLEPFAVQIFAAAVLDFEFGHRERGKRSSQDKIWSVDLEASPKMIDEFIDPRSINVGFKLESTLSLEQLFQQMRDLQNRVGCQWVIGNLLDEIKAETHRAYFMGGEEEPVPLEGREKIASFLSQRILEATNF
ncbi:MAG: bifunctional phosphopantothenoylcysteine decarboxylase/phosphopantothenate--cysteine ligase CoaBC [Bradymonadales bacterium]|nr:MAG: bifunctional phosphopantothenoylcysteine decarboxylase/phosphopantothenate--cysteine ligase CoaBC [Bradymonadales bacterium]